MPNFPPRARRRFDRRKLPASRPTLTGSRATTPVHAGRVRPHRAAAALRIAFGVVWAIDASLKWLPAFRETFAAMLTAAAQEQPSWLHPWFALWSGLSPGQATLFAYASATTETLLAVALVTGFARKTVYIGAAGYSLLVWATGEGFGGPYHAGRDRHRYRDHLQLRVRRAPRRRRTRRHKSLQSRQLSRAAHLVVVADRRVPLRNSAIEAGAT